MIIRKTEKLIQTQKKKGEFIYPYYEKYCFSNIPDTVLSLFNIKTKRPILPRELYKNVGKFKKIILLLIDGFGYEQWIKYYKDYEFFDRITKKGSLSPLTSIFPSTTAAAITTVNTGLTPQEHALPEWYIYFKEVDMILASLPFKPLDEKFQDKFSKMKANSRILFKGKTIYQKLKKEGIKSFSFCDGTYAKSDYSNMIFKGSSVIPFINSSDMVVKLRKSVEKESGPAYFFAYFGDLDSMEHEYGPHTEEYYAELSTLSHLLKKELLEKIDKKTANETLIIITADHGQLNILPKKTTYLNKYTKVVKNFDRSKKGNLILPTGGPRDIFLHIKPNKVDETFEYLSKKLRKKAKIMKISDAVEMGMFGIGKPRKEFYDRVGNLLILPNKNGTIWYEHVKGKKVKFLGHHGGLTKEEMLIPFAIAKLSNLMT